MRVTMTDDTAILNGVAEAIVTHNIRDFHQDLDLSLAAVTPGEIVGRLNREKLSLTPRQGKAVTQN